MQERLYQSHFSKLYSELNTSTTVKYCEIVYNYGLHRSNGGNINRMSYITKQESENKMYFLFFFIKQTHFSIHVTCFLHPILSFISTAIVRQYYVYTLRASSTGAIRMCLEISISQTFSFLVACTTLSLGYYSLTANDTLSVETQTNFFPLALV